MKIFCRSATDEYEDNYRPEPFNAESVDKILEDLRDAIQQKFGKRYKDISVDFDDIYFDDDMMKCQVAVYNNGVLRLEGSFDFTPYSDYWDITDYQQHKDTNIQKFVSKL